MNAVIDFLNTIFWGYVLIYGLLAVGVFFTIRLALPADRAFRRDVPRDRAARRETDKEGISPFQALCTGLASRVGTGNIAGVAVALTLGGPGAIFWMWMVALVGMATAYSESRWRSSTRCTRWGRRHRPLSRRPGLLHRQGARACPGSAAVFSVCLILTFGLVFNAVQANSIADAMVGAFGVPKLATGLVLAALTAIVIFGGIRQIASVAEYVVPFMAGGYLLMALFVLVTNLVARAGDALGDRRRAFGLPRSAAASPAAWPRRCSTG